MLDEISLTKRLNSPLYGSMAHSLAVLDPPLDVDIGAIRIFGGPPKALKVCVDAARLHLPPDKEAELARWPEAGDSLFAFAQEHWEHDKVFRPHEQTGVNSAPPLAYGRVTCNRGIVDAVCVTLPLTDIDHAWCMFAFLRCEGRPPFADAVLDLLRKLKPLLARVVRAGYLRESRTASIERQSKSTRKARVLSHDELLAKLSQAERHILTHLRSTATERQIARTIHRSPHTVHVHVKNIYRKLGIGSRRVLHEMFESEM